MKILITGSKGFVGTYLTRVLSQKHEVVSYDIVEGRDIFNEKLLNKYIRGVDIVVHLAAFVSGTESWEKPEKYLVNNGLGTFRVVDAALKNKVKRIIAFSSAAVYGKPLTPYGASKLWAETILNVYKDRIEVVIVRPFNIYGVGQNPAYGYAIHNFSEGINKTGEIEIFGSGNQTRDFIFIDDVVKVVEKLLVKIPPGEPVDLGTGKDIKIKDLAETIGKIVDKKYKIKHLGARKELFKSRADLRVLNEIGIDTSGFTTIEKGLRSVLLR
jgi:UDP-glucose 4-epimerase